MRVRLNGHPQALPPNRRRSPRAIAVQRFAAAALLCAALGASAAPAGRRAEMENGSIDARVDALLHRMTAAEKIGQLNQLGDPKRITDDGIRKGEVGALLDVTDPVQLRHDQQIAVEQSRLHIPLLLGYDVINGYQTLFPISLAQAASWDPGLVEQEHAAIAEEASAVGLNWTFAPMLDIARDPRWGRIVEGSGEDPYLGAAMAAAKVRGLQGIELGAPDHILACAKHFAGYGSPVGGRDYDSVYLPEVLLQNVYLPPFRAAVEAGGGSVMRADMSRDGVPASGNSFLLKDVLRRQWGFRGFVVSDSWAIHTMVQEGYAGDLSDAALRAFRAGENLDMGSQTYFKFLPAYVKDGAITAGALDAAVRPILRIKMQLGLFEHPYAAISADEAAQAERAHRALARKAAVASAVLLRNEHQTLPLEPGIRSIAVIGALADSQTAMMGSWPGKAAKADTVTVLDGIRERAGAGVRVLYEPGVEVKRERQAELNPDTMDDAPDREEAGIEKAVAAAEAADGTVLVLGEAASMNGEYASRASIDLPGRQLELMQRVVGACRKQGKPVVLVMVNGRPLDITWASTHVPAILEVWQPGSEGGHAVADLLFGDASPGGKLPVTWPRSTGQIPVFYARNATKINQDAKDYKSFYWDEPTAPLYPFGYGLAYTTFAMRDLQLSAGRMGRDGSMEATAVVENTGSRAGDEVVQLYIHQRAGSAVRPVRELKGFARVSLAPGESTTVRFPVGPKQLAFWSPASRMWAVEPGAFDVWVGDSSDAMLHSTFEVTREVVNLNASAQPIPRHREQRHASR